MKRIWTKGELRIAYYIAKWGYHALNITEEELVDHVIGDTSTTSLRRQSANFRFILGIDGYQLEHVSRAQKNLVDELASQNQQQVRRDITAFIDHRSDEIFDRKVSSHNKVVEKKKEDLNNQLQLDFKNKLAIISRGRNLRPVA